MSKKFDAIEELMECHQHVLKQLEALERAGKEVSEKGLSDEARSIYSKFFDFANTSLALHTRDEEQALFPLLTPRICAHACGAHGGVTPVEVMMSNHKDVHAAIDVIRTLLELAKKSEDREKLFASEIAVKTGFIVETMRDHIWKEDNVLYAIARQAMPAEELTEVGEKMQAFRSNGGFVCQH